LFYCPFSKEQAVAEPSLSAPSEAQRAHDGLVKQIISDLEIVAANAKGPYWAHMARAVGTVRAHSLLADGVKLRASQKIQLLRAIGAAHGSLSPTLNNETEQLEMSVYLGSLGHLARVWAGDLPKAGPALDADQFALAFELNMSQLTVLKNLADNGKALADARKAVLGSLLDVDESSDNSEEPK
jgi:hypothetical protein